MWLSCRNVWNAIFIVLPLPRKYLPLWKILFGLQDWIINFQIMDANVLLASSNFSEQLKINNESEKCMRTICVTHTLQHWKRRSPEINKNNLFVCYGYGAFASLVTYNRYLNLLEFIVTSQEHKLWPISVPNLPAAAASWPQKFPIF